MFDVAITVIVVSIFAILFIILYFVLMCCHHRSARFREFTACCFPIYIPETNIPNVPSTGQKIDADSDYMCIELRPQPLHGSISSFAELSTSGNLAGVHSGTQKENVDVNLGSLVSEQSQPLYARLFKVTARRSTGINGSEVVGE